MPEVSSEIVIAAPPKRVYELAKEGESFPDYLPNVEAVTIRSREGNRAVTSRRMNLRPRHAWYVAKWRLAYQPWVERKRAAHREKAASPAG